MIPLVWSLDVFGVLISIGCCWVWWYPPSLNIVVILKDIFQKSKFVFWSKVKVNILIQNSEKNFKNLAYLPKTLMNGMVSNLRFSCRNKCYFSF